MVVEIFSPEISPTTQGPNAARHGNSTCEHHKHTIVLRRTENIPVGLYADATANSQENPKALPLMIPCCALSYPNPHAPFLSSPQSRAPASRQPPSTHAPVVPQQIPTDLVLIFLMRRAELGEIAASGMAAHACVPLCRQSDLCASVVYYLRLPGGLRTHTHMSCGILVWRHWQRLEN